MRGATTALRALGMSAPERVLSTAAIDPRCAFSYRASNRFLTGVGSDVVSAPIRPWEFLRYGPLQLDVHITVPFHRARAPATRPHPLDQSGGLRRLRSEEHTSALRSRAH